MHDLERVALRDGDVGERRTRHDLQIALDRDPRRIEPDLGDQRGDRRPRRHAPRFAIDSDLEGVGLAHIV